ncbi:MAG: MMPL family transporter [candidate division Zixibacteria bacterium]|nr:MMPL family transporter [candidate division Zixibacteria bacterium]
MYLADSSIKRPVTATMLILGLVVLGLTSFSQMDVDLWPDIDIPYVLVQTVYPGANPDAVETEVTIKIEEAVNQVSGLDHIQSISGEGYSIVVAGFVLEKDGPTAAQEVREKVAGIRAELPDDVEEPVIQRFDFDAEPIMSVVISGERPIREITEYTRINIKRRFESIQGVGAVRLVGGSLREILVEVDPAKLEEFGFSINQINYAIQMANLDVPGGKIEKGDSQLILRTSGRLQRVSEFNDIIVNNEDGRQTYLSEVAAVYDTTEEATSFTRYNGREAVGLEIIRQSGANTVNVANDIREELDRLREGLPKGMDIEIVRDNSVFIEESIDDVIVNMVYGGTLAVLVIFLFLANIPSTLISAAAIPTSIIATFTFMRMLGFTINFMSLLALSLAVGLLIDDAIVVIENIYRHLSMGKSGKKAASDAASEIGLAVTATTLSIIVVFLPVAFMSGIIGRFFFQFGLSIAFAVAVSYLIAFTLTPMLSSRLLKQEKEDEKTFFQRLFSPFNNMVKRFSRLYYHILNWSLRRRFAIIVISTLLFIGSLGIGSLIGQEFMAPSDRAQMVISFEAPSEYTLQSTKEMTSKIEHILGDYTEVKDVLTSIGSGDNPVNEGYLFIKLVDKSDRDRSDVELVDEIRQKLKVIPGVEFSLITEQGEGGGEKPVEYSVRGPAGPRLERLGEYALKAMRSVPFSADVSSSEKKGKVEYQVEVDRRAASDLGLDVGTIAMNLRSMIEGDEVSKFREGDEEYDIRVKISEENITDVRDVSTLMIPSTKKIDGNNIQVPLGRVAEIQKDVGPTELRRFDRLREIRIGSNIGLGGYQGNIAQDFEKNMASINVPPGYEVGATGSTEVMRESFQNIFLALILAVVFIYLVLASQFENFIDPFSIMFSLPLSIVGALLGLWIFGSSISIMSLIGVVLLMGLVTKNAILLIDFAKQKRAAGIERNQALLEAGQVRLRPILMTSLSLIFGVLPLALAIGPGAEMRAPMARAVIGGMISSTFLTLIVVPVVYSILDDVVNSRIIRAIFGISKKEGTDKGDKDVIDKNN